MFTYEELYVLQAVLEPLAANTIGPYTQKQIGAVIDASLADQIRVRELLQKVILAKKKMRSEST